MSFASGALTSTDCVAVSTDGEMKFTWLVAIGLPASSTIRTGNARLQARRLRDRHVDVELEAGVLVDVVSTVDRVTRSPTRTGMSPTMPAVGRRDAVIRQLDLLLANLRLDGLQLRLGRLHGDRRLFVFLLAHGAGVEQLLQAIGLLPRPLHIRFTRRAHRFEAGDRWPAGARRRSPSAACRGRRAARAAR